MKARTQRDLFLRLAVAAHNFKAHGKQRDQNQLIKALDVAFAYLDPQGQRPTAEAIREAEAIRALELVATDGKNCAACNIHRQLEAAQAELDARRTAEQQQWQTLSTLATEARAQEARALRLVAYIQARRMDDDTLHLAAWDALTEADRLAIQGKAQKRTPCYVLAADLPHGACGGRHTCNGPSDCPGRG